jgi:general secretion pathway protein D
MKLVTLLALSLGLASAHADKLKMRFVNEDVGKILDYYSKETGQKFIVDPAVHGKITVLVGEPVEREEAFNQLSTALAINGLGISKQGDTMVVRQARMLQRDLIEVGTTLPSINPIRMYTWIYNAKYVSADSLNRELRILTSVNGEMVPSLKTNQLIFTDWTSNLSRIAAILKEVDVKTRPDVAKIVEAASKERELRSKEFKAQNQTAKTSD